MFGSYIKTPYICTRNRGNSSVGTLKGCSNGGIGRHEGLKIPWLLQLCGFKSRFEYSKGQIVIWAVCSFFYAIANSWI